MLLMTCTIQTYDVETAAGLLLLLFCVLIPISSTCQLLWSREVFLDVHDLHMTKMPFLRGWRASPLLQHRGTAQAAFQQQMSDKDRLEKASLFFLVFWGCRVSVGPIVSL